MSQHLDDTVDWFGRQLRETVAYAVCAQFGAYGRGVYQVVDVRRVIEERGFETAQRLVEQIALALLKTQGLGVLRIDLLNRLNQIRQDLKRAGWWRQQRPGRVSQQPARNVRR